MEFFHLGQTQAQSEFLEQVKQCINLEAGYTNLSNSVA